MKVCKVCEEINADSACFCKKCGSPLNGEQKKIIEPPPPSQYGYQQPNNQQYGNQQPPVAQPGYYNPPVQQNGYVQPNYAANNAYAQPVVQEKAGVFAIICSFLFPIVGVIIYFVNREKVTNPSAYLIAALVSFAINVIYVVSQM